MPAGLMTVALGVAMQVGMPAPPVGGPAPSETPNYPALQNAYNQYGFEGQYEQRYPFDSQQNWVHGYFQEIPAYGGHAFYRPYNYKDILSQSQTAAGWGAAPQLPYSQQFWHRYHDQATMLKLSQTQQPSFNQPQPQGLALPAAPTWQSNVIPTAGWANPGVQPVPGTVLAPSPSQIVVPPGYQLVPATSNYGPVQNPGVVPYFGPTAGDPQPSALSGPVLVPQ